MNKQDLIDVIAKQSNLTKAQVAGVIKSYHDTVAGTLAAGGSVDILGFGSYSVAKRSARSGRNPKTGEALTIKAAKIPKFKPGKALRDALN